MATIFNPVTTCIEIVAVGGALGGAAGAGVGGFVGGTAGVITKITNQEEYNAANNLEK